ncbi:PAS domain-containing protein [[Eubacterium] cellulosolvens]
MVGELSKEMLDRIVETIPIEISFIDKDDTVRFYNKHGKRIFQRTPSVIGLKVQNCHPRKSLDAVNQILEDFRNGKRDVAEFWISLDDKFIYIRYFPVQDSQGHYLGTLEVTQDITKIKILKGEKRLLS